MSTGLNWREINAVLMELDLEGSIIRDIRQPVFHELVFEIYHPRYRNRFYILVSFSNQYTRIHRLSQRPRQLGDSHRFVAFMRAHIRHRRIQWIGQLNTERIIKIQVTFNNDHIIVWMRLWANAANCIVTDSNGRILDALFRQPKRGEITGGYYNPERDLNTLSREDSIDNRTNKFKARQFGNPAASYSSQVEAHFIALEEKKQNSSEANATVDTEKKTNIDRMQRRIHHLHREQKANVNYQQLSHIGDLLMANISLIEPYAVAVIVSDFRTGLDCQIELKPNLSPTENAQEYFRRAKLTRRRFKAASLQLQQSQHELSIMIKTLSSKLANDATKVSADANVKNGVLSTTKRKEIFKKNSSPAHRAIANILNVSSGTFSLLVGRTAQQNDILLRYARGNDYWFHCRDYTGAHIFIRYVNRKSVPLETLLDAGNLAVYFSKARSSGQADVYYTQAKYLRRPQSKLSKNQIGRVMPTRERNLLIRLDMKRVKRILSTSGRDLDL